MTLKLISLAAAAALIGTSSMAVAQTAAPEKPAPQVQEQRSMQGTTGSGQGTTGSGESRNPASIENNAEHGTGAAKTGSTATGKSGADAKETVK